MPKLRRLDRGIPPPILLGQPAIQALHFCFDVRRIGFHARLPDTFDQTQVGENLPDLREIGRLCWAKSLARCVPGSTCAPLPFLWPRSLPTGCAPQPTTAR